MSFLKNTFYRDIVATVFQRLAQIVGQGLLLVVLPLYLDPVLQGIYFTATSLVSTQIIFELGVNSAIIQIASHLYAREHEAVSREINGLRIWSRKWFARVALLFATVIGYFGAKFLQEKLPPGEYEIIAPWLLAVGFATVQLMWSYRISLIEASGGITKIAVLKIYQSVVGFLLCVVCLIVGGGLYVLVVPYLVNSACLALWLRAHEAPNASPKYHSDMNNSGSEWREDLKRLQLKMALSYISGYVSFQLVVPIVYYFQGPVSAGKVGLAMAIFNAVVIVCGSFISAKNQHMAKLIAQKKIYELQRAFNKLFIFSVLSVLACSMAVIFTLSYVEPIEKTFGARVVDVQGLWILAAASFANVVLYCQATYLRSHKEEPISLISIASAFVTILCLIFGATVSADLALLLYLLVLVFMTLPLVTIVFLKRYMENRRLALAIS